MYHIVELYLSYNVFPGDPIPEGNQVLFWMGQFSKQVADGNAVFRDCKKFQKFMDQQLNSDPVTIQRIYPRSNEAKQYTMDSLDIKGMQKVINDERRNDKGRYIIFLMNYKT